MQGLDFVGKPSLYFVLDKQYALKFYSGRNKRKLKLLLNIVPKFLIGYRCNVEIPTLIYDWIELNDFKIESCYTGILGNDQTILIYCSKKGTRKGVYIKYAQWRDHNIHVVEEASSSAAYYSAVRECLSISEIAYRDLGSWLVVDDIGEFDMLNKSQEVEMLRNIYSQSEASDFAVLSDILDTTRLMSLLKTSNIIKTKVSQDELESMLSLVERISNLRFGVCPSHGDFTPWNVGWQNSYVILDFEKYCSKRIVGYDIIHYLVQKLLLVENRADDEIIECVGRNQIVLNVLKNNQWALHIWALYQIDSYLESYENLSKLHWQGYQQLNLWIRIIMREPG
jgi:hypothetical protein